MRILYLTGYENKLYNLHRNQVQGVLASEFFRSDSTAAKLFRRIALKFYRPALRFFFNEWRQQINSFDLIIISGTIYSHAIGEALITMGLNAQVLHWFWNPITPQDRIDLLVRQGWPVLTFDQEDASRYGLTHVPTYYFSSLVKSSNTEPTTDVYFVGGDKGRLKQLLWVQQELSKFGIKSRLHITDTGHSPPEVGYRFQSPIPYNDVLQEISQSKCLLDYVQEGQTGLTQRPMEAIFHRKKLITNDQHIIHHDFYHKDNIFVLGRDNFDDIPDFLRKPYHPIDQHILMKYDFTNWVVRLYQDHCAQK